MWNSQHWEWEAAVLDVGQYGILTKSLRRNCLMYYSATMSPQLLLATIQSWNCRDLQITICIVHDSVPVFRVWSCILPSLQNSPPPSIFRLWISNRILLVLKTFHSIIEWIFNRYSERWSLKRSNLTSYLLHYAKLMNDLLMGLF